MSAIEQNTDAKHTPGPWEFKRLLVYRNPQSDDRPRRRYYDIAHVCHTIDSESMANARLIAAAPELLEAAKGALLGETDCRSALGAAIDKAEGLTCESTMSKIL